MSVIVVVVAAVLTAFLAWYFFAPRASQCAVVDGDVQVQTVTVKGGYSPSVVEVVQGVRARLLFDRQDTGDCSSRVFFPDPELNQGLPAYATTAVESVPDRLGEFGFACGMNMLHGTVKVVAGSAGTLLDDHHTHCVAEAAEQGGPVAEEKLREASAAIARLVRL